MLLNQTKRFHFGLFSYRDINPGDFIGMYTGKWIHESENFEFGNKFAVTASNGMSVAPPQQYPNPQIYSIAMANEPQAHGPFNKANAFLRELIFDRSDVQVPQNLNEQIYIGLGLFACELIPANTEILWFYGDSYQAERVITNQVKTCTFQGPFKTISPLSKHPFHSTQSRHFLLPHHPKQIQVTNPIHETSVFMICHGIACNLADALTLIQI